MNEFTVENDETLVHLVSNIPEIYDPRNVSYKLTLKKGATWKKIGEIMNKDGKFICPNYVTYFLYYYESR